MNIYASKELFIDLLKTAVRMMTYQIFYMQLSTLLTSVYHYKYDTLTGIYQKYY